MLLPISNVPRAYSWGSPDLIPALVGRASTGQPEAEIWYGDHPGSPSRVSGRSAQAGLTLDAALAALGEPSLPFLLKLLAAGSSLSIQAHPTKTEAEAGFAREEADGIPRDADDRLYRDDNHKPEIIVALSDEFRALVGLRPVAETRELLAVLSRAVDDSAAGGGPALGALDALLADGDEEQALRSALAWALSEATPDDVARLTAALDAAASETTASEGTGAPFGKEVAVLRAAASDFPGDRGLFVALLMNLVVLRRGEALFAPAGVLHAYQSGLGVELMAASDNVLRGGLTPKHVDVPELLRIVDAAPGPAPIVEPTPAGDRAVRYDVGVPDFALTRVELDGGTFSAALEGPAIVLATRGSVRVAESDAPGEAVELRAGDAVYAGGGAPGLEIAGSGEVFLAQPGRR
ncbi:MAG: mannose-6-phosphate isomerase, class I [Microbacterium sp.]|uniref:mannose-6-phosphate isomerase, class I n=1 Tax=Microbacterium sp. TaxID=51671 RepID=UPI001AC5BA0E|nr:mannose-6-phosphate isomerase, class I [Microbacterium sp.]MBN9178504.1 mannose-6-phosphate isomerase, class I [Microbacterium sp.]